MDSANELRRGGSRLPRSREGAPQVRCVYRQDKLLTPEVISPVVRLRRGSHQPDDDVHKGLVTGFSSLSTSAHGLSANSNDDERYATIFLKTNLVELDYPEDLVLYDYKIKVEPDIRNVDRDTRRALFVLFENSREILPLVHDIVHDGARRLIADRLLPEGFTVTVPYIVDEGGLQSELVMHIYVFRLLDPKELRAEHLIRHIGDNNSNYSAQSIVSAFNLILAFLANHTGIRRQRRGFHFFPPTPTPSDSTFPLGMNLETWKGLSFTTTPLRNSLMVSSIASVGAFYIPYQRLSDAMLSYAAKVAGGMDATSFYRDIRVATTYLGYCRRRRIKAFGVAPARRTMIYAESFGRELTVEQYFKLEFGISLEHADDLPVVNIGTSDEDLYVPPELCRIEPGQGYSGPLPRGASVALGQASIKTMNTAEHVFNIRCDDQRLANFGLTVSSNRTIVSARVLPPPKLLYHSSCPIIIDGSWTTASVRFFRPAQLRNLAIVVICEEDSGDVNDLEHRFRATVMDLLAKCRSFGMQLDTILPKLDILTISQETSRDPLRRGAINSMESRLMSIAEGKDLVLVVLPGKGARIYSGVKSTCIFKLGIHCLCEVSVHFACSKSRHGHISALAMRMNTLLGGVNHSLDQSSLKWLKKTMLVGVSVARLPFEGSPRPPSVAAVTASRDGFFVHYPTSISIQECTTGLVTDMKQMMRERLEWYRRQMNSLPMHVIVFRGGIPDSQIRDLQHSEIVSIREAFKEFKDYGPTLTFIICTKSHRIRFYPADSKMAGVDDSFRVAAGTVVDGEVDSPHGRDFYLHTHAANQREARATRYTILYDDRKFSIDTLQGVVNDISYLHPYALRGISLPPPLHWARRANRTASLHLRDMLASFDRGDLDNMSTGQMTEKLKEAWGKGTHDRVMRDMFYL